jgi:hypothetical protein
MTPEVKPVNKHVKVKTNMSKRIRPLGRRPLGLLRSKACGTLQTPHNAHFIHIKAKRPSNVKHQSEKGHPMSNIKAKKAIQCQTSNINPTISTLNPAKKAIQCQSLHNTGCKSLSVLMWIFKHPTMALYSHQSEKRPSNVNVCTTLAARV